MDASIYFQHTALDASPSISHMSTVNWTLFGYLTLAWVAIFMIIYKGIESAGKVVYFTSTFPYIVMFIMLIRGVTLTGASKGIEFYITPKFDEIFKLDVWIAASTQVFYSLGVGFSSLIAFGSYNKRNTNFYSYSLSIPIINALTSIFAGFVVFSVLGYLSHITGKDIDDLDLSGSGLAFEAYPAALAKMDGAPFFAFLFFLMLFCLGVGSEFAMTEV